jgi:hypothetical protein
MSTLFKQQLNTHKQQIRTLGLQMMCSQHQLNAQSCVMGSQKPVSAFGNQIGCAVLGIAGVARA